VKVHSGALKPEDQLTQHLPAQTGSALISTAPAGAAVAHGCREPGDPAGKSLCCATLAAARSREPEGDRAAGQKQSQERSPAAAYSTGGL